MFEENYVVFITMGSIYLFFAIITTLGWFLDKRLLAQDLEFARLMDSRVRRTSVIMGKDEQRLKTHVDSWINAGRRGLALQRHGGGKGFAGGVAGPGGGLHKRRRRDSAVKVPHHARVKTVGEATAKLVDDNEFAFHTYHELDGSKRGTKSWMERLLESMGQKGIEEMKRQREESGRAAAAAAAAMASGGSARSVELTELKPGHSKKKSLTDAHHLKKHLQEAAKMDDMDDL